MECFRLGCIFYCQILIIKINNVIKFLKYFIEKDENVAVKIFKSLRFDIKCKIFEIIFELYRQ